MRFLVIEDNPKISDIIKHALEEHAYQVETTASGHEAESLAARFEFDLIILDLMLPDHDGITLCKNLRRIGVSAPILMLTALSDTDNKVAGLEAGADDYLTKPFELEELVARVRALLRRTQASDSATLKHADLEVDLVSRTVIRGDTPISLTSKEFALLEYFMRNPDRVLTRTSIGEHVWDMNFVDESNVIEVYISRLRNKIDRDFDKQLLHTVIGTGYVFSATRES